MIADPGQFGEFDLAMARMPQEIRVAIEQDDPKVDSFLEKMVQDDARHFFVAARMRVFGAKTLKELVLMQRECSLKGLAEKIECPTLVCDNVGDAVAGGQGKELYEALRCPKDYVLFTAEEGAAGHCEGGAQVLFHRKVFDWLDKTLMEAEPRTITYRGSIGPRRAYLVCPQPKR